MLLAAFLLSIACAWKVCEPSGSGVPTDPYVFGLVQAVNVDVSKPHL